MYVINEASTKKKKRQGLESFQVDEHVENLGEFTQKKCEVVKLLSRV